jgi:serine/threonine protein kinase
VKLFFETDEGVQAAYTNVLGGVEFAFNTKACASELEVQERVLHNFAPPLEVLMKALGVNSYFGRPAGDRQVLFDPDITWKIGAEMNSSLGTIIEVKPWFSFNFPDNIVGEYEIDVEKGTDSKIVRAIQQIYSYMSFNYLRYGILTTYKETCFFQRSGNSQLLVTNPIALTGTKSISLLQCWLYVLYKSHEEGFYSSPAGSPFDHATFDLQIKPIKEVDGIHKTRKYNLTDINSSQVRFAGLAERKLGAVAKGLCGTVVSGSTASQPNLKLKIIDSFNNQKALANCEREVAVYERLELMQGKVIPTFYGFYNLHGILIIVLENCGSPLPASQYSTFKVKVNGAIKAINKRGVQHNDLEIRSHDGIEVYPNILLRDGDIKVIDFHKATIEDNAVDIVVDATTKRKRDSD